MPSQQPNISTPALQASLAHAAKRQCPKGTQGAVLGALMERKRTEARQNENLESAFRELPLETEVTALNH